MKFLKTIVGALAGFAMSVASPVAAQTVMIEAGSVIVDADSDPTGPMVIVVVDGVIEGIYSPDAAGIAAWQAEGVETIDLSDKTVLPGLIDLHTHLSGDPSGEFWRGATTPPEYYTLIAAKNARQP